MTTTKPLPMSPNMCYLSLQFIHPRRRGDMPGLRRPAFARRPPRLATSLARHGSHPGLTPGSVALHLVSARARAADSDNTPGPPGYAGLLALLCSSTVINKT